MILLDTWLMLARDDVRVEEESHRRWFNALALDAPARRRSRSVTPIRCRRWCGPIRPDSPRESSPSRAETHLPPTARLATVAGPDDVLAELATRTWTPHTEILGPVPVDLRSADAGSG